MYHYVQNLVALILSQGPQPYFFISGGALKDSYLGVKPLDFDMFSPEPEKLLPTLQEVFGNEKDVSDSVVIDETDSWSNTNFWFFTWGDAVISLSKKPCSHPHDWWAITDYVDCMSAYDSNKELHKHELFEHVVDNKIIKFTGITTHMDIAIIRCMLRLSQGWTLTSEEAQKFFTDDQAIWQTTKLEHKNLNKRREKYLEIINSRS